MQIPPITTANAIVTGSDCDLTNILLQQLSIACYFYLNDGLSPSTIESVTVKSAMTEVIPASRVNVTTETHTSDLYSRLTSFKLAVSSDGDSYRYLNNGESFSLST